MSILMRLVECGPRASKCPFPTKRANLFGARGAKYLDASDNRRAVEDGRFSKPSPDSCQNAPTRGFVRDVVTEMIRRVGVAPADRVDFAVFHDDQPTERDWDLRAVERGAKTGALLEPAIARRMLTAVKRAGAATGADAEVLRTLEAYLRGRGKA